MLTPAAKILGGAGVAVIIGVAGAWAAGRAIRGAVRSEAEITRLELRRALLDSVRAVHDSTYGADTVKLRTIHTTVYQPLRDSARKNPLDTALIGRTLRAADSTIKQCFVTITSCERRVADRDSIIANRDSLVTQLRKPIPTRRLTFPTEGLYDVVSRTALVRAGAEFRLVWDFSAKAEGEFDQQRGFAARLGLRKTF